MHFISKSLRSIAPHAAGLALALSITARAEPTMPETPPDVKAAPADAQKSASGLASKVLQAGKGDQKPGPTDNVTVHYSGWTTDGKLFDSSVKRGQPASFPLTRVIPCWTEGVQKIKVGGKAKLVCPPNLAYGDKNIPGIPPNSTLIFEVELLGIKQ